MTSVPDTNVPLASSAERNHNISVYWSVPPSTSSPLDCIKKKKHWKYDRHRHRNLSEQRSNMAEAVAAGGAAASALGAVVAASEAIAAAAPTHRQCNLEITNACEKYSLCNPRMFLESGWCEIPQSPFIPCGTSDVAVFVKIPHTARGSVGVITYDLQHNKTKEISKRMAVMFSVPYDFNFYSNVYAVGIFDQRKECNEELYNEMYDGTNDSFVRKEAKEPGCLIYRGKAFTIMATMSDAYQPVIKLRLTQT